jgi:hypothetical protein
MSIVSDLLALGWTYGPDGVLRQPPGLDSVPLAVFSDWMGDRYRIKADKRDRQRLWIRGHNGQILGQEAHLPEVWD